jgi:hypothetical protein
MTLDQALEGLNEAHRTAFHEAGHAVIAVMVGRRHVACGYGGAWSDASNAPAQFAAATGFTTYRPVEIGSEKDVGRALRIVLAGPIAERMHDRSQRIRLAGGGHDDRATARELIRHLHPSYGELFKAGLWVRRMLRRNWTAVDVVAARIVDDPDEHVRHGDIVRALARVR